MVGGGGVAPSSGRPAAALSIAAGSTALQVIAAGAGCGAAIDVVTAPLVAGESTTLVMLPNNRAIALSNTATSSTKRVRFVHAAPNVGTVTVYDGPYVAPPATRTLLGSAAPFAVWSGSLLDARAYWAAPASSSPTLHVAGGQSASGVPSETSVQVLVNDPRTYFVVDGPSIGSLEVVRCESGPCSP